ncbi:pxa domain-containing protein [Ophiostoma piceae UAMH 11346]|uniref:Pxa domain-containing protein n=1 Tax=Ophiostoma piceae (strain UAMH 11346) TaxID=1262450 RepID=S3C3B8_OPHP1|nr:pxa domain-containing protein [Ophiostoma piceae UAMH 11346]
MAATESGPALPASPTSARHAPSQPIGSRLAGVDPLSDKATILLIRRTLCPSDSQSGSGGATTSAGTANSDSTPIEDILPPLTSRNDVDLQLYALLAVVVREFVLTWYGKITPDDDQFVTEIVQIVAHCTRALEQRLRKVDLESLLFDEIPQLLDNHVGAYRASRNSMVGSSIATDTRAAYHALWPLPALSPVPSLAFSEDKQKAAELVAEQSANEAAYRQLLVGGLLAVLLPTEDLENECLTSLVGQIFSELLIGNVLARRVAEPWMMWEIVGLVSRIVREKMEGDPKPVVRRRRAAAKRHGAAEGAAKTATADSWLATTASNVVLSVLNAGFVLFATIRFLVASFTLSRSLPPRGARSMGSIPRPTTADSTGSRDEKVSLLSAAYEEPVVPVLSFSVWTTACNIVQLQVRMPWLYGTLSMLNWLVINGPGCIAALNGPLDR